MGYSFVIVFLQLFTALGFGKSTASISCIAQYLCLNIESVFTARAYVYSSLELQRNLNLSSGPFSRPGPVIPPWSWASFFTSSTMLIFDGLTASDLHWIGKWCFGGCANRFLYVLVSLSQKDWVCKAWVHFLPRLHPKINLNFVFRTDSMIMTLMSYSINSGLLTWWDLERSQSHTHTNPRSILTTGVLIAVRGFPHILMFLPCLMLRLVLNPALLYDLAHFLLANG